MLQDARSFGRVENGGGARREREVAATGREAGGGRKKNLKRRRRSSKQAVFLFGVGGFDFRNILVGEEVSCPPSSSSSFFGLLSSSATASGRLALALFSSQHQGASGHAHAGVGHLSGTHVHIQGRSQRRSQLVLEPSCRHVCASYDKANYVSLCRHFR